MFSKYFLGVLFMHFVKLLTLLKPV